jgi:hypothetical protein
MTQSRPDARRLSAFQDARTSLPIGEDRALLSDMLDIAIVLAGYRQQVSVRRACELLEASTTAIDLRLLIADAFQRDCPLIAIPAFLAASQDDYHFVDKQPESDALPRLVLPLREKSMRSLKAVGIPVVAVPDEKIVGEAGSGSGFRVAWDQLQVARVISGWASDARRSDRVEAATVLSRLAWPEARTEAARLLQEPSLPVEVRKVLQR